MVVGCAPTSNGNQLCHSAQERMMSRNPTDREKERNMTAGMGRVSE
jgi:hypothetical protein